MQYYELHHEHEIAYTLGEIRKKYGSLSQFVVSAETETTMSGKSILTLYLKFDPTLKIEGDADLVATFATKFKEAVAAT